MSVIYTSKDISKKLKIGKSLVREISKQLEKAAYEFTKNQETRIYSEKDFILIQMILETYNTHQNLHESVQIVLTNLNKNLENEVHGNEYTTPLVPITVENVNEPQLLTNEISHQEEIVTTPDINVKIDEVELADLAPEIVKSSIHSEATHAEIQLEKKVEEIQIVSNQEQPQSNQIMFEEFMSQISNLANQNELILKQNQTLIQQNLEKDQKLEKILHSVEEKSKELQELASVIEEKDEKLELMFEEIQIKDASRDAQLMRMLREMQETKKMVAASKEKDWKSTVKSFFIKPKTAK